MIVTCQNCDTSFHLDDARVPPGGVRVRCSRCKQAFFLRHPEVSPEDLIHETARDALVADLNRAPDTTQDLVSAVETVSENPPIAEADSDDEPDWEFNIDPPLIEAEPEPLLNPEAPADFSETDNFGSQAHPLESEFDLASEETTQRETVFGSVDDYSSLMVEDSSQAANPSGPSEPLCTVDGGALGHREAESGFKTSVSDPTPAPGSFAEDFLSGGFDEAPTDSKAFLARLPLKSKQAPDPVSDLEPVAGEFQWGAGSTLDVKVIDGPVARSLSRGWIWTGRLIGWSLTLALMAVVLGAGLWPQGFHGGQAGWAVPGAPFRIHEVTPSWVETARGDWRLRIRALLAEGAANPHAHAGSLRVTLTDRNGQPVAIPAQALGRPLSEFLIREGTPSALSEARALNQEEALGPWVRSTEPFEVEAVIEGVPEQAIGAEFEWVPHLRPAWREPTDQPSGLPKGSEWPSDRS